MALWGLLDNEASKPKYLNTADKANTYGADTAEVGANAGVKSEGWVQRKVVGSRTQWETLVAMSSGSMGADVADFDDDSDAGTPNVDDDTILADS
jgi:hypothetical protein|tara:strand:+ start:77 stop:361 length:285 start_codon:yes stop_codon:yes gene_type:complete